MLERQQVRHPLEELSQQVSVEALSDTQEAVKGVHTAPSVKEYNVAMVNQTRKHQDVYLSESPPR